MFFFFFLSFQLVNKVYEVIFVKNFYHLQTSFHCILLLTCSCLELFITFDKYWMLEVSSKAVKVTKISKVCFEQGGVICVCVCVYMYPCFFLRGVHKEAIPK